MNGRFFAGQQLLADFWDGITNFATGAQNGAGREDDEVTRCCPCHVLLKTIRRKLVLLILEFQDEEERLKAFVGGLDQE